MTLYAWGKKLIGVCLALICIALLIPASGEEGVNDARQFAEEVQNTGILYADEDLSIRLISFETDEAQIKGSFEISCPRDKSCLVTANIPQSWYYGDDGTDMWTALQKMEDFSGTQMISCTAGETIQYHVTWERGLCYDLPLFGLTPVLELGLETRQISCPVADLNGNEQVGFTCFVTDAPVSTNIMEMVSSLSGAKSAEFVVIRLQSDEP